MPPASSIASAPISGYTYRQVSLFDFSPEASTAQRAWSPYGVYALVNACNLWASMEIPAGALVRDIEWYARNASGATAIGLGRYWRPDSASLYPTAVDVTIGASVDVAAYRATVPLSQAGPLPVGTKLFLGLYTGTDGQLTVNGVRVGFSQGAGATGLLPTPVRAYDSRVSGGKLAKGSTRVITLPASAVPAGTTAALVNITATNGKTSGYLKVYPGNASAPASSAINFAAGPAIANAMTVGVSSARQIRIYASADVHVIVDVSGTVG